MTHDNRARTSKLPSSSRLELYLAKPTYIDSFKIDGANRDIEMIKAYAAVLGRLPRFFRFLMYFRTVLVAPFGLKGPLFGDLERSIDPDANYAEGGEIWRWRIFMIAEDEVVTGMDDKHLDFRVSLLRQNTTYNFSTAVKTHNLFGKFYLAVILPFHRFGVKTLLNNAVSDRKI